jgi:chitin disaccharide deacetylase
MNPLSLIVTADDFGIGRKTSEGILRAHLHGPVTATSLMTITGDHVRASVPLLADAPNLDVGLHIVLTQCGEKPVMARPSSGLVDRNGEFFSNGQLWWRAFTGKLDQVGVADEIAAQVELFHKLVGKPPAYVDGHHHAHQLPIVRESLLDVMAADLLPRITRITTESPRVKRKVGSVRLKRMAARFVGRQASERFLKGWVWTNDSFFGMLGAADLRRAFPWDRYLKALPDAGAIEWVVHPGLPDESLVGRDDYHAARNTELEALTSEAGVKMWEHLRPNLTRKSVVHRLPHPEKVGELAEGELRMED